MLAYSELIRAGIVLAMLIIATICDLTTRKIPNWLTLPALLFGVCMTGYYSPEKTKELAIFLGVFFMMGCIGVTGWGDIKCVMAVASFVGWIPATISFVVANIFLFVRYMMFTPKEAINNLKDNAKQLITANVKIDETKPKHIFAPFLLTGYVVATTVLFIIQKMEGAI